MTIFAKGSDEIKWKKWLCEICGFTMIETEKPSECWNCKGVKLKEIDMKNDNKGL